MSDVPDLPLLLLLKGIHDTVLTASQVNSIFLADSLGKCKYIRGDANNDSKLTVSDVVYLINYLFKGGPLPVRSYTADNNCDGKTSVSDVVYLINYLFKGGPPPGC